MTSHYLRCNVKSRFENVFQALSGEFGDIYAREFGKPGESLKGVILGEHYFFRVKNDAALLVTLEQASDNETRVEIIACAAGEGLMGISYGAHDSYVHSVEDFLAKSGFSVQVEKEISYFDRNSPLY
jgi:predicted component of type VI protein secretion system